MRARGPALAPLSLLAVAAPPAVATPVLGFNDTQETFATHAASAREAGASVARIPVNWGATEPVPRLHHWQSLDAAVSGLEQHVVPVFTLFASPDWASGSCIAHDQYTCGPGKGHTDDYVRFAHRLLDRYPGALMQSWNEPDIPLVRRNECRLCGPAAQCTGRGRPGPGDRARRIPGESALGPATRARRTR